MGSLVEQGQKVVGESWGEQHLKAEWAQDRVKWRGLIGWNRPTRASMEKRT